jgi:hypothetical protein
LRYLPLVDCLPFKKNANIFEKMKAPAGAIPDSTVIHFVYEKDHKTMEYTADQLPADLDSSYIFIKRYDKIIRKGNAEPEIKDFSLISESKRQHRQYWENPVITVLISEFPRRIIRIGTNVPSVIHLSQKIYRSR